MRNIIEKILYFFLGKKAEQIKKEAFLQRNEALLNYAKSEERFKKKMSKYSGRKRYQKA